MRIKQVQLPNILTLSWILVCLKMILIGVAGDRSIVDYILYFLLVSYALYELFYRKLQGDKLEVFREMALLIAISIFGVIQNPSNHALTSVIGLVIVMSIIISCGYGCMEIQYYYIVVPYYLVLFVLVIRSLKGDSLGNTIPGVICFLSCGYIVSMLDKWKTRKGIRERKLKLVDVVALLIPLFLVVFVGWQAGARTAVLTVIGIICIYFLLSLVKPNPRQGKRFFWIVVLMTILLTCVYINVRSFEWYDTVNSYSLSTFSKNVSSSRPFLWSYSLESLSIKDFFFGKGTGILPAVAGYASSSFHNSFIQLLMQNGIIGLAIFVFLLRQLWKQIAVNCDDTVCRLVLAVFIGVIIYNSFETTLLQNKIFLGICEWMIICMGIIRSRKLSEYDENVISIVG